MVGQGGLAGAAGGTAGASSGGAGGSLGGAGGIATGGVGTGGVGTGGIGTGGIGTGGIGTGGLGTGGGNAGAGGMGGSSAPQEFEFTIASGLRHTCLVKAGRIYCWGDNSYGQLGIDGLSVALVPVAVPGISDARVVAAGNVHTCAIRQGGQVLCWGGSAAGDPRLGRGDTATGVGELSGFNASAISAGFVSTCAITGTTVNCWGYADFGVLGNNSAVPSSAPTPVVGLTNAVAVSVGPTGHACAVVTPDRRVYCWGRNASGALGDRTTMDSGVPVLVQNLAGAAKVAAGSYSTCALLVTGQVTCWGDNSSGALGDGTMMERLDPVTPSIDDVKVLRAGNGHWCAVQNSGHVACWGQNGSHQTGSSQDGNVLAPFIVPGLSDVVAVSGGTGFTCARRQTGDVSCWGTNNMGQLGNSTVAPTTTPTRVMLP